MAISIALFDLTEGMLISKWIIDNLPNEVLKLAAVLNKQLYDIRTLIVVKDLSGQADSLLCRSSAYFPAAFLTMHLAYLHHKQLFFERASVGHSIARTCMQNE